MDVVVLVVVEADDGEPIRLVVVVGVSVLPSVVPGKHWTINSYMYPMMYTCKNKARVHVFHILIVVVVAEVIEESVDVEIMVEERADGGEEAAVVDCEVDSEMLVDNVVIMVVLVIMVLVAVVLIDIVLGVVKMVVVVLVAMVALGTEDEGGVMGIATVLEASTVKPFL